MGPNEPGQPTLRVTTELSTRELATPSSALAIGAHPDDVEFGAGGLLAKWAAAGCIVHHLICTDGSKGTWDPEADLVSLAATREVEQRDASRRLAGSSLLAFVGVREIGDQGGAVHGQGFAAPDGAESFGGARLDRDAVRGQPQEGHHGLLQVRLVSPQLRALEHDRAVNLGRAHVALVQFLQNAAKKID